MACGASKFSFYIWAPFLLDLGVPRGKDATTASSRDSSAHRNATPARRGDASIKRDRPQGKTGRGKNAAHTPTGNSRGHGLKNLKRPKNGAAGACESACALDARARLSPLSPPRMALPFPPHRLLSPPTQKRSEQRGTRACAKRASFRFFIAHVSILKRAEEPGESVDANARSR